MQTPVILKYASAAIIFVTTLIGCALVMCVKKIKWQSRLEALASGVFLGAGLAHLLGESFEELGELIDYPLAPAVCLGTFAILTFVEMFTFGEHDASQFHINVNKNTEEGQKDPEKAEAEDFEELPKDQKNVVMFGETCKTLSPQAIVLYIIMLIHSITAGLALGILTTVGGVVAILCAIVGHKPVEAFAVAFVIIKEKPTKIVFWILIVFYTLMTPAGIIAGALITEFVHNAWALGVIGAFSAGTFLFVGAHEWAHMVAGKAQLTTREKFWHYAFFFIGIIWMLLIAIVETVSPEKDE